MEESGNEHKLVQGKTIMIMSGTSRFMIIAALLAGATTCLASEGKQPDWSYTYTDDFQDCNVESDSYYHSIFWPQGAYPPKDETYLYRTDVGQLGFGGLGLYNQVEAELVYRFPLNQERRMKTISGEVHIDVTYPIEIPGNRYLKYSLSSDGINWSVPKELSANTNTIHIRSIRGICYIRFRGMGALIDNLVVNLNSYPADFLVPTTRCPTIQAAIDLAPKSDGNEVSIEVAPGTYKWHDIDFKGKAITVYSSKGAGQTAIDCENTSRGFYFHTNEDTNSVLRGFTIKNGKKTGSNIQNDITASNWIQNSAKAAGAGIFCDLSSPSIVDCIIQDCTTQLGAGIGVVGASPYIADCLIQGCDAGDYRSFGGYGAGVALIRDSNAVIVNTTIKNNAVYYNSFGGGVYCRQSSALLANCEIRKNSKITNTLGVLKGGGVYAGGLLTDVELRNCIIADNNNTQAGSGIYADSIDNITDLNSDMICNVFIKNCTIADNILLSPQGSTGSGVHSVKSGIVIENSIIWSNSGLNVWIDNADYGSISYSDIQGGSAIQSFVEGQGNKSVDPCFAPLSAGDRDYHLKSYVGRFNPGTLSWAADDVNSACLDAGDPGDPVGSEPYQNGKRINMGAYGGTDQASKNYSPRVIHVAPYWETGSNLLHSGTSRQDAYETIQKAVDVAHNGDYVLIWPGTYYEEVFLKNKAITIQSADEPAIVTANSGGYAFSFVAGESIYSVLRNLVIANCNGELGGAVFCSYSFPTLTNLSIVSNSFGISTFEGAQPVVTNCIFRNNKNGDYDIHDTYIIRNISYCCLGISTSLAGQKGNFAANPLFVDETGDDFHLKSKYGRYQSGLWIKDTVHSPCIDAGDSSDFSREPLNNGNKINLGADGGTPYTSKSKN